MGNYQKFVNDIEFLIAGLFIFLTFINPNLLADYSGRGVVAGIPLYDLSAHFHRIKKLSDAFRYHIYSPCTNP